MRGRTRITHVLNGLLGLAAIDFLEILVVAIALGLQNRRLTRSVEHSYLPAAELSQNLKLALVEVESGIREAARSRNPDALKNVENRQREINAALSADRFSQELRTVHCVKCHTVEGDAFSEVIGLASDFTSYWNLTHKVGGGESPASEATQEKFEDLMGRLSTATGMHREQMDEVFGTLSQKQRLFWGPSWGSAWSPF